MATATRWGMLVAQDVEAVQQQLTALWNVSAERPCDAKDWAGVLGEIALVMLEDELGKARRRLRSLRRLHRASGVLAQQVADLAQLVDAVSNGRMAEVPPSDPGVDLRALGIRLVDPVVAERVTARATRALSRRRGRPRRERQDEAREAAFVIVGAVWDVAAPTVRRIVEVRRSALQAGYVTRVLSLAVERLDLRKPPIVLADLLPLLHAVVEEERARFDRAKRKREASIRWAFTIAWPTTVEGLALLLESARVPVHETGRGLAVPAKGLRRTSVIDPKSGTFAPGPLALKLDF